MDQMLLRQNIEAHFPFDEAEAGHQSAILSFVEEHHDFYKRTLASGHTTGSAWIINPAHTHALMLHHKKLDRWLQPGGHTEQDSNLLATALREAREETGIIDFRIISDAIFDIDIHAIPSNKKENGHLHYDIRYLLEVGSDVEPIVSDESNEVKWFSLEEIAALNDEPSIQRMILKTIARANHLI